MPSICGSVWNETSIKGRGYGGTEGNTHISMLYAYTMFTCTENYCYEFVRQYETTDDDLWKIIRGLGE